MSIPWDAGATGVLTFPSGRRIRGRGLRREAPPGPNPELGVYLVGTPPVEQDWESRWLKWWDFWVPSSRTQATAILTEAWEAASDRRVELACGGGVGRTGTALAVLAVIDGLPAAEAVGYVRKRYHHRAVETPWQRRFVERFSPA